MPTKTAPKQPKLDIYQEVTDTIIAALERGVVPWRKPWSAPQGSGDVLHRNFVSKKAYRGVNVWLLDLVAASMGYEHPYWLTYKQAKKLGGQVRKGENSSLVVFWKTFVVEEELDNGDKRKKVIPMLRYYRVFNIAQCDGLDERLAKLVGETKDQAEFDPIERAEWIMKNMPKRPKTMHAGDRAFYAPMVDRVTLPKPQYFDSQVAYYNTAFHEYVHATGHELRLGRVKDWTTFGSDPYAKEELVAEMGAAMLSRMANLDVTHEENAAYIASWLKVLQDDKKFIVNAAAQAQKASDFILGVTYEEKKEEVEA